MGFLEWSDASLRPAIRLKSRFSDDFAVLVQARDPAASELAPPTF
jgi:hypothetical protein